MGPRPAGDHDDGRMEPGPGRAGRMACVLGPVSILDPSGRPVLLGGLSRELLAAVASGAGRPVDAGLICRSVWAEDTPAVRQRLRTQLVRLRPHLPDELRIEHGDGGYRLAGDLDALDATRFERMARRTSDDPAANAARLRAALELWQGPVPFEGVANDLPAESTWRLIALRERVTLELARVLAELGEHREVVALVDEPFADDPTRGDLVQLLASGLARTGREVAALRALGRHRRALTSIGAEMAPDLDALEQRILRHELPTTPESDGATSTAFRRRSFDVPRRRLERDVAAALRSGPVCLIGEMGAGKSVLAGRVSSDVAATDGRPVVHVTAPSSPPRPMDVVRQLLLELQRVTPAAFEAALRPANTASAWHRLVGTGERSTGAVLTRDELILGLADLVGGVLDGGPAEARIVAVVEDLHHADPNSIDVFRSVVARAGRRLLFTSRHDVGLGAVADTPDAAVVLVDVSPLTLDEVDEFTAQFLPTAPSGQLAADLRRRTGGNPLFLVLLLEVMAEAELVEALPSSLAAAVLGRCSTLSPTARAALDAAALLGASFDPAALEGVVRHAADGVAEAARDGLLVDEGSSVRFVHEVVAEVLESALAYGTRVSLHDRLCERLQQIDAPPEAVARQAVRAVEVDPDRAARWSMAAAHAHAAVFDWGNAESWSTLGLSALGDAGTAASDGRADARSDARRAELSLARGIARRRNRLPGSDLDLLDAARAATVIDDANILTAAATELCLHGPTTLAGSVDPRARAALDRALASSATPRQLTVLRAAAATLLASSDEWPEGRAMFHEALARSAADGDPVTRRDVLLNSHMGLGHPADLELRRAAVVELEGFEDAEAQWESAFLSFGVELVSGSRDGMQRAIDRMRATVDAVLQRSRDSGMSQLTAVMAMIEGDLDRAEAVMQVALAAAPSSMQSWSIGTTATIMFPLREAQGRAAELRPLVAALRVGAPTFASWRAAEAAVAAVEGDLDASAVLVADLHDDGWPLVEDLSWSGLMVECARAVHAVGRVDAAEVLYERLLPYAGQMSWNGLSTHGPIDAGLALFAATAGDHETARRHADAAVALLDRMGATHLLLPEVVALV